MLTRRRFLLALAPVGLAAQPPNDDELRKRWNEFAALANKFAVIDRNLIFPYGLARDLSVAWRRVEMCKGWPDGNK